MFLYFRKKRIVVAMAEALGSDPYWNNVVLLQHLNNAYTDEKGHTVTTVGSPTFNSSTVKFGDTSCYFNGSSAVLSATSPDFILPDNFTVEFWAYPTGSYSNYPALLVVGDYTNGILIRSGSGSVNQSVSVMVNNTYMNTPASVVPLNQWSHVAMVRVGTVISLYVNGALLGSMTLSGTINSGGGRVTLGCLTSAGQYGTGYIDEVRVTKGIARYTSAFSVPTKAFPSQAFPSQAFPNWEPVWGKTVLLLKGNGTNNGQNNTFLDSSSNALTITRNGNVTQGSYSPFSIPDGYWSASFDGNGDYVRVPKQSELSNFDFTIELWVKLSSTDTSALVAIGSGNCPILVYSTSNQFKLYSSSNGSTWDISNGVVFNSSTKLSTWYHISITRTSGNIKCFCDGILGATIPLNAGLALTPAVGDIYLGAQNAGTVAFLNGTISNLRIVNGTALYTANFTPSTMPLTAVSGTSLLTCQSNRFKDNSANALTITPYGDAMIVTDTPFNNPNELLATYTGSAYFDGTGDYLKFPVSPVFNFGSSDFTIEFWYNKISGSAAGTYARLLNVDGDLWCGVSICDSGVGSGLRFSLSFDATAWPGIDGPVLALNTWHHIALVRSGSTFKAYINGVGTTVATDARALYYNSSAAYCIGGQASGRCINGYLSNFRVSNVARYTTNFVPSFVTNDANTTLLLNFNNAQVVDSTGRNVIETVGDVKTVTTNLATGTGSIYFDGTGDYLVCKDDKNFIFGLADFTIEFWIKFSDTGTTREIFDCRPASTQGSNYLEIARNTANKICVLYSSSAKITGTSSLTSNLWYHVAVTRISGYLNLYINGTLDGTFADSTTSFTCAPGRPVIGTQAYTIGTNSMYGYIDDFRITKDSARYTVNFVPQMSEFPAKQLTNASYDPYWNNVVLSQSMDTSFVDAKGHTVTTVGSPTINTATVKYGAGSCYVNGSSSVSATASPDFILAGDFTVEFWAYPTGNYSGYPALLVVGDYTNGILIRSGSGTASQSIMVSNVYMNTTAAVVPLNQWSHVAMVRSGSIITLFVNGVIAGTMVSSASINSTGAKITLGALSSPGQYGTGYIDSVRITNGIARYTAAFNIPTAAFPQQ